MGEKAKDNNSNSIVGKRNVHENARFSEDFHLQNPTFGLQHKSMNTLGS